MKLLDVSQRAYSERLEAFLENQLQGKTMPFLEIVCRAEGAYPTDVLKTLDSLVSRKRLEKHRELYGLVGQKYGEGKGYDRPIQLGENFPLNALNVSSVFSNPHPADYDWRYTSKAKDELVKRLEPHIQCGAKVALFGAPTLLLSLHKLGMLATLFDVSSSTLADLEAAGITAGRMVCHDLFDRLPEFSRKFDVVVADPPWYVQFDEAFILRSSEILKQHGTLMLSVLPWLTRPSAIKDRSDIIAFAIKAGFCLGEVVPGAVSYQTPKFEQIALSMQGVHCGNWRVGDLFVFRKVAETTLPNVPCPKDEPTWDEYRFGDIKVKLRRRVRTESGRLVVQSVSEEGPYLRTVSRRSPLRRKIDLWTSDNVAYSVSRPDIVRASLNMLQSGKDPKVVVEAVGSSLSPSEKSMLLKLLMNVTIPYELDEFHQSKRRREPSIKPGSLGMGFHLNKFIIDHVLPGTKDAYWQGRLNRFLCDGNLQGVHLAVFVEPYLRFILEGRKTVESRFTSRRYPPYEKVQPGDILLLKRSSGPVVGLCEVASVWFYHLDADSWKTIKTDFAEALCVSDPSFWETRKHASYATLMRITHVSGIAPVKFPKSDRRGWVLLSSGNHPSQMELR